MLMEIKCSAVTSIKVDLKFDDGNTKERVIGVDDLISVIYNSNGLRKKAEGRVISVSAVGTDPKAWYIIVDNSDSFKSDRVRFAPTSILDLEIIRKADQLEFIQTPIGHEGIPYMRLHHGRLQYSNNGYNWRNIVVDKKDVILPAEGAEAYDHGTIGLRPENDHHHFDHCVNTNYDDDEDSNSDDSSNYGNDDDFSDEILESTY